MRVHQKFPIKYVRAGRGVAREGDTCARTAAHIPEYHRLDIDSGAAEFLGNIVEAAIRDSARIARGLKHRVPCHIQLLTRRIREIVPGLPFNNLFEFVNECQQIGGIKLRIQCHTLRFLPRFKQMLKFIVRYPEHNVAEHLNEAAIRIVSEAFVLRTRDEPLHRVIVQPEVQDSIHHPRH